MFNHRNWLNKLEYTYIIQYYIAIKNNMNIKIQLPVHKGE